MSTVGELANTKCSHCRDILHWPLFARRVTSRLRDARRATKVNDNDRNHESLRRALHDLCCAFQHVDHTLPNYTNTIMFLTLRSHPSFLSYVTNAYRKKKNHHIVSNISNVQQINETSRLLLQLLIVDQDDILRKL